MDTINYMLYDYWQSNGDPRIAHYPLMSGGPIPVFTIIAAYLCFVLIAGPRLMRNRKPLDLRRTILAYNIANILLNMWFFVEAIRCLDYGRLLFDFEIPSRHDRSTHALHCCRMAYIYTASKFVDLADTIFFVLRKKRRQISFLHVYHHSAVPVLCWFATKLVPTAGPAGIFPLLNSVVHTVMYAYYAVAALGPRYRSLLVCKRYITILQLAQFICFILYGAVFLVRQRGFPRFFASLGYAQSPLFFAMFYRFFRRTYYAQRVDDDDRNGKTMANFPARHHHHHSPMLNASMDNGSSKTATC